MGNTQTTTAVPNQEGGAVPYFFNSFAPLLLIMVAFYFLMIRPQKKHEAKKKEMIANLRKGDKVITASGIVGTIHKVMNEEEVSLEIAEGVNVRLLKTAIIRLDESANSSKSITKPAVKAKGK